MEAPRTDAPDHSADAVITDDDEAMSHDDNVQLSWYQNPAQITAMVSNFSTSYNVVNISIVLPILQDLHHGSSDDAAACASSLLAGMILGQIVGGALGDSFLGRLGALRLVMAVQIVGSVGSALIWGDYIYIWLAAWRFLLGIGSGAVYPLAATLSAEHAGGSHDAAGEVSPSVKIQQLKSVVLTFSMQGFGFLTVPLVGVTLLFLIPESSLNLVWRLILGFGCIPGVFLVALQCRLYRSSNLVAIPQIDPGPDATIEEIIHEERQEPLIVSESDDLFEEEHQSNDALPGIWNSIRMEPDLLQKLLGTAGTWFLFDILFYGNTLFQPIVLEAAFGGGDPDEDNVIKKAATNSLILALIALPGYGVSALLMGKKLCNNLLTPRYVQMQGFVIMGLLYAVIGACWTELRRAPALLVFLYGMTFFFANFGPNTTTFVFPSLIYSHDCRSTLNGISAAAGKAGALVGATLFAPAAASFGDDKVMLICAGVSIVAFGLTQCFTRVPAIDRELVTTRE
ncbi:sugar transporter [Fragilaria crotonensis]|nr:sugar transporter [Fragilaria crotonensis]